MAFENVRGVRCAVVVALLKMGVVSATEKLDGNFPHTPLRLAVMHNLPDVVLYLSARDNVRSSPHTEAAAALVDAASLGHADCIRVLLRPPTILDVNARGRWRWTPLHYAASNARSVEAVQALLDVGASVELQTASGENALHLVCMQSIRERSDILRVLLSSPQGASVKDVQDRDLCTPLHWAAQHGLTQCVELLCAAGCQIHIKTDGIRLLIRQPPADHRTQMSWKCWSGMELSVLEFCHLVC